MKDLKTRVSQPQPAPRTADAAALAAEVARELLTQADSGVTRISYVGLRERAAVQLVIDARYDGLEARTTRGGSGQVSITLAAPDEAAAPVARAAAPGAWQRAWARLWASGRRIGCLLGRRTP
ncbi:MAG TPA: hypothetical protein VFE37_14550 [Chloroflexota bacterium]|nr:hypothetical protein [Chloroflexota bacterium]